MIYITQLIYIKEGQEEVFHQFEDVQIDVEQLMRTELRFLSPLVSESMFERLRKRIGWNVIITAVK